jgi:hypothetical protein
MVVLNAPDVSGPAPGACREWLRWLRFRIEWAISPRLRQLYTRDPALLLLDQFRGQIASGPFKGMKYINSAAGSCLAPKIAGTYERELAVVIRGLKLDTYDAIVDIGAAEGYYAVGLARMLSKTSTRVFAFDSDPIARQLLAQLAEINQVTDRIESREYCSHETLQSFSNQRVFLICDIEGGELQLLDPDAAPVLRTCDMLVEVHDEPGSSVIQRTLSARFRNTHHIEEIQAEPRNTESAAELLWLKNAAIRKRIFDEKRFRGMRWFYMRTKQTSQDI